MGQSSSAKRGKFPTAALVLLAGLLVAPTLASFRIILVSPLVPITISSVFSVVTFILYLIDKRRAQSGDWRVPEATLHVLELIGGWPGAFLAQRLLRHKNAKLSFQIVFWLIVFLHQYIAIDYLIDWRLARLLRTLI